MPIENNKDTVIIEPLMPTALPVNNIGPSNFNLILVSKSFNLLGFEPFILGLIFYNLYFKHTLLFNCF